MSVAFVFHPAAWEHPLARWTVESIAGVLELRWRTARHGERLAADEAPVFVGPESEAPSEAAAVLVCEHWAEWDPDTLFLSDIAGVVIPAPRASSVTALAAASGAPAGNVTSLVPRVFPAEWLRALGFMLAREEEFIDDRRDQWECFSGTFSRMHELGALDEPIVNRCVRQLERRVIAWHEARGRTPERIPRWKDDAAFAVALTHDVDDVAFYSIRGAARLLSRARRPHSYAVRGGLTALARSVRGFGQRDPYDQFDRWVEEEERREFRSSFYFVPGNASRHHEFDPTYMWSDPVTFDGRRTSVSRMMARMVERGFDVGLHGSYLSHVDSAEIGRQKRSVEHAAGHVITGGRQHFLRFDVRRTWEAQERAGMRYDTTLGYNEAIGFRAGIAAPFRPWNPSRRAAHDLIEVPLTVMDGTLFRTLGFDATGAIARTQAHLEKVEEVGGLAGLLWHPNAVAQSLHAGWWQAWLATLDWLAERDAWVTSAGEIAAWWRQRERIQRREA